MQDWLAHRARATPSRQALINAGSGNAWSYATLDETVEEMAGRLHALGVDEADHLGAVLGAGVEGVCLVHAAMRLGTTLVPLSPEFTPPELSERFDRADVDAVVCDAGTEDTVRQAAESLEPWLSVLTIDNTDWSDATPLADAEPTEFTPRDWNREDVQLLLFTSGTTGRSKAVPLTMGNLLASATASAFRLGIDPEDRWLVPLSLHHMGGIAPVLRSALYGTTTIIRESFDPGGTVDDIRAYDATCISLVPTMLRRMLSARGTLPDCLRFLLVGGAPCPEELIHRCRDYSVPICPTYGMTETASQIATARHREAYENPGSVGRPLLWTDVTVVDEAGDPIEPGETGELVVDGPTVTPGYYDDPAATGEAMGPYGLHTGDVGYQDEQGRLYVLNRLDDRILTGGENVDPGEVTDAISEHPEVAEAAVVGLPDEQWGEQVAALLVPKNEPVSLDELESFLRDRLAGFKLPRTLGFTEELPRTVSGTVERETVRNRLTEGETVHIEQSGTSGRAATETESGESVISGEIEPEIEEPTGGARKLDAEGLEAQGETSPATQERKGSAALSANPSAELGESRGDGVHTGLGAALGTGRGSTNANEAAGDSDNPSEKDTSETQKADDEVTNGTGENSAVEDVEDVAADADDGANEAEESAEVANKEADDGEEDAVEDEEDGAEAGDDDSEVDEDAGEAANDAA